MIPQSGGMKQYQEEKDMKKIVTTEAPAAIGPRNFPEYAVNSIMPDIKTSIWFMEPGHILP